MRRDQSTNGSDYRREHNQEMWDRILPAVQVPLSIAAHNYQSRLRHTERTFEQESGRKLHLSGSVLDAIEDLGYCPFSRRIVAEQGIGD